MQLDLPIAHNSDEEHQNPLSHPPLLAPNAAFAEEESTHASPAPMKRRRLPKLLVVDSTTILRSRDLIAWTSKYNTRMKNIEKVTLSHKAPQQGKKNAEFWILGFGINGVGVGVGESKAKSPLDLFAGPSLYQMITGSELTSNLFRLRKRARDTEATEADSNRRNVKPRIEGDADQVGDEGLPQQTPSLPPQEEDIEVLRGAEDGLNEVSLALPWNVSSSIRGSSIPRSQLPMSTRMSGSATRFDRIASGSPLAGRGGLHINEAAGDHMDSDAMLYDNLPPLSSGESRAREESISMHAQEQDSVQQRAVLDRESLNFLDFIEQGIEQNNMGVVVAGESIDNQRQTKTNTVTFEELMPPSTTSRSTAAHALLHVLSLNTKNLIEAKQTEDYGTIQIRTTTNIA